FVLLDGGVACHRRPRVVVFGMRTLTSFRTWMPDAVAAPVEDVTGPTGGPAACARAPLAARIAASIQVKKNALTASRAVITDLRGLTIGRAKRGRTGGKLARGLVGVGAQVFSRGGPIPPW